MRYHWYKPSGAVKPFPAIPGENYGEFLIFRFFFPEKLEFFLNAHCEEMSEVSAKLFLWYFATNRTFNLRKKKFWNSKIFIIVFEKSWFFKFCQFPDIGGRYSQIFYAIKISKKNKDHGCTFGDGLVKFWIITFSNMFLGVRWVINKPPFF